MEFRQTLARRRMVRNFSPDPVPGETVDRIAMAALRAPSAGNSQAVSVVVVTDEPTRKTIAGLAGEDEYVAAGFHRWVSAAPAHLVLTVSVDAYRARYREADKLGPHGELDWPVPYWWIDAGASLMAVLLAAVDEGLAAGFLGAHSIPGLRQLLSIPSEHIPIGVVTVGKPLPDRRSKSLDRPQVPHTSRIHHQRWSG